MKKYAKSDYALNKFSAGIVYRFADGKTVTIMPEDTIAGETTTGVAEPRNWKAISDDDYLDRARNECRETRKNVPFDDFENAADYTGIPLDEEYLDNLDKQAAIKAFDALLASGKLTATQERRFRLHFFEGLSYRNIADCEGVYPNAIEQSIAAVTKLLKKYFAKI
jgi:DNA-directed RNA polymerase specialized sigma24 family protein